MILETIIDFLRLTLHLVSNIKSLGISSFNTTSSLPSKSLKNDDIQELRKHFLSFFEALGLMNSLSNYKVKALE